MFHLSFSTLKFNLQLTLEDTENNTSRHETNSPLFLFKSLLATIKETSAVKPPVNKEDGTEISKVVRYYWVE